MSSIASLNNLQFLIRPGTHIVIAALVSPKGDEDQARIGAVANIVENSGGIVVARLVQRRGVSRSSRPGGAASALRRVPLNLATLFGKGKVAELAAIVRETDATVVLFANVLTETQRDNLEQETGATIVCYDP